MCLLADTDERRSTRCEAPEATNAIVFRPIPLHRHPRHLRHLAPRNVSKNKRTSPTQYGNVRNEWCYPETEKRITEIMRNLKARKKEPTESMD